MGKQINFLMDNELEDKFMDYILLKGIILYDGNNMSPVEIKTLPNPFSGKGWFKVYLYKNEFGLIKLNKIDGGRECIDAIGSPVIEFSRTIIRDGGKEISRGRLWVEMNYYNENNELLTKSKDLDDWFRELSRWIKEYLPKTVIVGKNKTYSEYSCTSINNKIENGYKVI